MGQGILIVFVAIDNLASICINARASPILIRKINIAQPLFLYREPILLCCLHCLIGGSPALHKV